MQTPAVAHQGLDAGVSAAQRMGHGDDGGQVGVIHREDVIEAAQVGANQLAGPTGQVDAAPLRRCPHAPVRGLPRMPASRAGRIHRESLGQPLLLEQVQENPFGRR